MDQEMVFPSLRRQDIMSTEVVFEEQTWVEFESE